MMLGLAAYVLFSGKRTLATACLTRQRACRQC
jgi:hypothetical protein